MYFYVAENALSTKSLLEDLQCRVSVEDIRYGEAYVFGVCKAYVDTTPGKHIYHESFVNKRVHEIKINQQTVNGFYDGYIDMMLAVCEDACLTVVIPTLNSVLPQMMAYFADPSGEDFIIEGGMEDDAGVTRLYNGGLYDRLQGRDEGYFKTKIESTILPKYL